MAFLEEPVEINEFDRSNFVTAASTAISRGWTRR
jgi:hypothetical protein